MAAGFTADYDVTPADRVSAGFSYSRRSSSPSIFQTNLVEKAGVLLSDYDRFVNGNEVETNFEATARYHAFAEPDRDFTDASWVLELRASRHLLPTATQLGIETGGVFGRLTREYEGAPRIRRLPLELLRRPARGRLRLSKVGQVLSSSQDDTALCVGFLYTAQAPHPLAGC